MKALADVDALIPEYKSGSERKFAAFGVALLGAHFLSDVMVMLYEPMRFKIPGGNYTPDFLAVCADGTMILVEIKGSRKQRNYRDARSKLRAARATYPYFTWCEVVEQDGWKVEVLNG